MTTSDEAHETSLQYMPALDGFRGVAVLLVVAFHLFGARDVFHGYFRRALYAVDSGWIGVDMFFVLSGYLITRILLSTRESPRYFRSFYARRFLRIFPLYYGVLFVILIVLPHFMARTPAVDGVLHRQAMLWTYTMDYEPLAFGGGWIVLVHFWSLAVEEQFYILWPLAMWRASLRHLRLICVTVIVAAPLFRLAFVMLGDPFSPYFLTSCRADALAIGGLLAVESVQPERRLRLFRVARRAAPVLALIVAYCVFAGYMNPIPLPDTRAIGLACKVVIPSLVDVFFAALLVLVVSARRSPWAVRPLRWVGRYSYGIYVFHYTVTPIATMLFFAIGLGSLASPLAARVAYFAIATATTFAFAFASWHLWEKHFLALKSHFTA